MMKKIFSIVFVLCAFVFTGCEKDEVDPLQGKIVRNLGYTLTDFKEDYAANTAVVMNGTVEDSEGVEELYVAVYNPNGVQIREIDLAPGDVVNGSSLLFKQDMTSSEQYQTPYKVYNFKLNMGTFATKGRYMAEFYLLGSSGAERIFYKYFNVQ
jgi:hypothetical protein